MSVDFVTRFPVTTLKGLHARERQPDRWVFHETIHSSLTLLYGRSNVGKSFLVSSLLLSLMIDDREFMGMQPVERAKMWKPAILWTDPGSNEEYYERIYPHLGGTDADIPMFHIGRTTRADEWVQLTDHLLGDGRNFVVVDNLYGASGDTNDSAALTTVFDGLTRLTSMGVPVVLLHHESEHGYSTAGASPMGLSVIKQKARTWIQVRQTARRKLRGGNTALIVQGNALDRPQEIVAEPMAGPNYRVIQRGPWAARADSDQDDKPKQNRRKETLDQNASAAQYVIDHCQGLSLRATGDRLGEQFPGTSWRNSLSTGALSKMVKRVSDSPDGQTWQKVP